MSLYNINNKLIYGSYGLITACEPYTPPPPSYETTIGTQTWMTKNLDVDDGLSGISAVNVGTHAGLDMGTQYFYTWDAAKRVASSVSGWRLPTGLDWGILSQYIGTSAIEQKLKSTQGWTYDTKTRNGTNDYGFNAMPVGYINDTSHGGVGGYTYYWTNENNDTETRQYTWELSVYSSAFASNFMPKRYGMSVRLIKE